MTKFILAIFIIINSLLLSQEAEQPIGSGVSDDPFEISSLNNLIWITQNHIAYSNAFYIQTSNINASGTQYWDASDDNDDGNPYNDANDETYIGNNEGFKPIGESYSKIFIGNYNGDGYKIDSLFINRNSEEFVGLFGWISQSVIDSLKLSNVSIAGDKYVGGLVGLCDNSSSISNSSTSGEVRGNEFVGGLVGYSGASNTTNSFSTSTIVGGNSVGGLLGRNFSSTVSSSFSTGNVTGDSDVGGFIGGNVKNIFTPKFSANKNNPKNILDIDGSSTVKNCFTHGNVNRTSESNNTSFGGFCGYNNDTLKFCYSTGSVTFIDHEEPTNSGFVGNDESGIYLNNFWNSTTSNQSVGVGANAETAVNMKIQNTYTTVGWDFKGEQNNGNKDIWEIDGSKSNGYPYLHWQITYPLPVELTIFNAKIVGSSVILNWETATEINNYGFEIQRQTETPQLTYKWEKIGFQEGHGNSSTSNSYTYTDNNPFFGIIKYRLKQIDINGEYKYSEVIIISFEGGQEFQFAPNYPNPFNATTNFLFTILKSGNVSLLIYNIMGEKVVEIVSENLEGGSHIFVWNTSNNQKISSGVYFARLTAGKYSQTRKIVLLK